MSNLKLPSVLKRSGVIIREEAIRGGTVLVGELSGGNCPGGNVREGIYLEPRDNPKL